MAIMIPPYISDDVKSTGERLLFDCFAHDPGAADWYVLHSLGLARHVKNRYGEIDFVVIAPDLGIFCLEVKSGSVSRKNGVWEFTNRYGESTRKARGPFEQAQEGMFSLLEGVRRKYGNSKFSKFLFGYGVMFPHIYFENEDLDHESWKVYDRLSRRRPVSEFIKRLAYYERQKAENERWFSPESLPRKLDAEALAGFLRGDFERIVSGRHSLEDRDEEIKRLTEEQYICLDQLRGNKRCLFKGAAGTGKTMLAMELVRRSAFDGKRVGFFCYNKLLGRWLSKECASTLKADRGEVGTFHKFMLSVISKTGEARKPSGSEFFTVDLPIMTLEALENDVVAQFDTLILDEGQDLIRPEYLDVLDAIVKGGLAGGNWYFFCDFERQAIYSEYSSSEMLSMLEERAGFTHFTLTVNCRNTRQIGEETSLLTGFESPPFLPSKLEGVPVEYRFYPSCDSQIDLLSDILNVLRGEGVPPGKITILSPCQLAKSVASRIDSRLYRILDLTNASDVEGNKSLTFSTIQSYKGLENSIIILCDITKLDDEDTRSLLYVGTSRAKDRLYILVSAAAKQDYYKLLKRSLV